MKNNSETPVILMVDEYEALKDITSELSKEQAEGRRILHEIFLLGRANPVDVIIKSHSDEKLKSE